MVERRRIAASEKNEELTPLQLAFVYEYCKDYNVARAVRRAGFAAVHPASFGAALLKKPKVLRAIQGEKDRIAARHELSIDWIKAELIKIARSSFGDFIRIDSDGLPIYDFTDIDYDKLSVISDLVIETATMERNGFTVTTKRIKVKLYDKMEALVNLGRHVGLFEKESNGNNVVEIIGGLPKLDPLLNPPVDAGSSPR